METYKPSERLPECGQVVRVLAGNSITCEATFDGIVWRDHSGRIFHDSAVREWWPLTGDGNGKALEYRAIIEKEQELAALRERIAYDAARTEIEINCLEDSKASGWWDTLDVPEREVEWIADRVRYLDGIGKLERMAGAPHIVRILELEAVCLTRN